MNLRMLISRLAYKCPGVCHDLILRLTGYRLIKVSSPATGNVDFVWTKQWPLPAVWQTVKGRPVPQKEGTIV